MTKQQIIAVLDEVRSWPREDREELAEVARDIAARRKVVYVLTDEERAAIEKAERSPIVSEKEVKKFWKRHGIDTA